MQYNGKEDEEETGKMLRGDSYTTERKMKRRQESVSKEKEEEMTKLI